MIPGWQGRCGAGAQVFCGCAGSRCTPESDESLIKSLIMKEKIEESEMKTLFEEGCRLHEQGKAGEAFACFLKAASAGHLVAMGNVAFMYVRGLGVEQNPGQAFYWWKQAAGLHDVDALYRVGMCYDIGLGVEKNEVEAVRWYEMAASKGQVLAQHNLAMSYETGAGVQKDAGRAYYWHRMAAAQGLKYSQFKVAMHYADMRKAGPDKWWKAARWAYQAARQELPEAEYMLSVCYGRGLGVELSYTEALYWMSLAAEHGHPEARTYMSRMKGYERPEKSIADAVLACELEVLAAE